MIPIKTAIYVFNKIYLVHLVNNCECLISCQYTGSRVIEVNFIGCEGFMVTFSRRAGQQDDKMASKKRDRKVKGIECIDEGNHHYCLSGLYIKYYRIL